MSGWAQAHGMASPRSLYHTHVGRQRGGDSSPHMEEPHGHIPGFCLTQKSRLAIPGRALSAKLAPQVMGKQNVLDKPLLLWLPVPTEGGGWTR